MSHHVNKLGGLLFFELKKGHILISHVQCPEFTVCEVGQRHDREWQDASRSASSKLEVKMR